MKRARRLKAVVAAGLSAAAVALAVVDPDRVAAMAAIEETAGATEAAVVAVAGQGAAGNLGTNHFQALDAPFIRKGEVSWLEDQVLLFKNAKRN
jgi:hypothetical protein